jgi:hypothetical protein
MSTTAHCLDCDEAFNAPTELEAMELFHRHATLAHPNHTEVIHVCEA